MILIANSIVKQSKRQKAGKLYLWILITTYYLLSKNWDIFATRCCILLIFNHNYFRGGEVTKERRQWQARLTLLSDDGYSAEPSNAARKNDNKQHANACSSMSCTHFAFIGFLVLMPLICVCLWLICNIFATQQKSR